MELTQSKTLQHGTGLKLVLLQINLNGPVPKF